MELHRKASVGTLQARRLSSSHRQCRRRLSLGALWKKKTVNSMQLATRELMPCRYMPQPETKRMMGRSCGLSRAESVAASSRGKSAA